MIKNIEIENFKSIKNLSIDLGRVNVLIGANGSGKTNFLEAVAMAAAANSNKLEYEFLSNRIRLSEPKLMYNAFPNNPNKQIKIKVRTHNNFYEYIIERFLENWTNVNISDEQVKILKDILVKHYSEIDSDIVELFKNFENNTSIELSNFLIYTPEYTYLKKFEEPGQIIPLGIKGEGLFYVIKQIFGNNRKTKQKETIKKYLHLFDWFDDIHIPENLMFNEYRIAIKDKFLDPEIKYFDQKSTNEGFLFLLFYLVLFTSKNTPKFFAIDNIETGFNPKLCRKLMTSFVELSKDFKKQVILTTHNPAVLDGLNLNDDSQRLYVVYRKNDGSTAIERIKHKPTKMKLSELWMSGIIGGLPDNF